MIFLHPDEIVRLHRAVITSFGGLSGDCPVNEDEVAKTQALSGRIRSAMYYCHQLNWNNPFLCAAAHAICIAKAHAFADGNKRTALNAAALVMKRAGIAVADNTKLPALFAEIAKSQMKVEDLALKLENLMTSESTPQESADAFKQLSIFNLSAEVINAARAFAQEQDPRPTLYIVRSRDTADCAWALWTAVIHTLELRHKEGQEKAVEELLNQVAFAKDNRKEILERLCSLIIFADYLKIRSIWPYFRLGEDQRCAVLQAFDERAAAGRRTVIMDDDLPERYFNRQYFHMTKFFEEIVLCDLAGRR